MEIKDSGGFYSNKFWSTIEDKTHSISTKVVQNILKQFRSLESQCTLEIIIKIDLKH